METSPKLGQPRRERLPIRVTPTGWKRPDLSSPQWAIGCVSLGRAGPAAEADPEGADSWALSSCSTAGTGLSSPAIVVDVCVRRLLFGLLRAASSFAFSSSFPKIPVSFSLPGINLGEQEEKQLTAAGLGSPPGAPCSLHHDPV